MRLAGRLTGFTLLLSLAAMGAPISGLFNTGVDSSGALLVGGNGTVDPNYTVISGPGISSPVQAVTYYNGAYFADGPASRWISVNANGSSAGSGTYVFQTTFDLTGFNPATASISVQCGTDNALTGVTLNGGAVAGDCDGFSGAFSGAFNITSGFQSGINMLQFSVQDFGAPMALRAQFTSDVAPLNGEIPEPSTAILCVSALGLIVARRRLQKLRAN